MSGQRKARLGDWTVCQDKDTTKTSIRTNHIDPINQINLYDWAIADFRNGKETPYIYVPNRVYPMDTVILKPTLEGLMPIPENIDGNCEFDDVSFKTLILAKQPKSWGCSATCPKRWPPTSCGHYSQTTEYDSPTCPHVEGGVFVAFGYGVRGAKGFIDFEISASSAFEYLELRFTDWKRDYTDIGGVRFFEHDELLWKLNYEQEEWVKCPYYIRISDGVYRVMAFPGGNINWGPYNTFGVRFRVEFTLMGDYLEEDYVWGGEFPETTREVRVSYGCAGRRGNHR